MEEDNENTSSSGVYNFKIDFTIKDIKENPNSSLGQKCGKYLFENKYDSLQVPDLYVLAQIPEFKEKVEEKLRTLYFKVIGSIKEDEDAEIQKTPFKRIFKYKVSRPGNSVIEYETEATFSLTKKWQYIKVDLKIKYYSNKGPAIKKKTADYHWLDFFELYSKNMSQEDCDSFEGILSNIKKHTRKIL